jgi:ketosteroid isomerase-like protein
MNVLGTAVKLSIAASNRANTPSPTVLGRYGGTMRHGGAPLDSPFCYVYRFHGDKAMMFQQYTDTAQWTRLMT